MLWTLFHSSSTYPQNELLRKKLVDKGDMNYNILSCCLPLAKTNSMPAMSNTVATSYSWLS